MQNTNQSSGIICSLKLSIYTQISTSGGALQSGERRNSDSQKCKSPVHERSGSRNDAQPSFAGLYCHNNSSTSSLSKKKKIDKIVEIGKPTGFEHGIHVEYNNESGKYLGLPDVWVNDIVQSDEVLNTKYLIPYLVPSPSTPEPTEVTGKKIGHPYNVKHQVHVVVNETGITGLPSNWEEDPRVRQLHEQRTLLSNQTLVHQRSISLDSQTVKPNDNRTPTMSNTLPPPPRKLSSPSFSNQNNYSPDISNDSKPFQIPTHRKNSDGSQKSDNGSIKSYPIYPINRDNSMSLMSKANPSQESITSISTRNSAASIPTKTPPKTPPKTPQRLPLKDSQKITPKKVLNIIPIGNQMQMPKPPPRDSTRITSPLFKGQPSSPLPPTPPPRERVSSPMQRKFLNAPQINTSGNSQGPIIDLDFSSLHYLFDKPKSPALPPPRHTQKVVSSHPSRENINRSNSCKVENTTSEVKNSPVSNTHRKFSDTSRDYVNHNNITRAQKASSEVVPRQIVNASLANLNNSNVTSQKINITSTLTQKNWDNDKVTISKTQENSKNDKVTVNNIQEDIKVISNNTQNYSHTITNDASDIIPSTESVSSCSKQKCSDDTISTKKDSSSSLSESLNNDSCESKTATTVVTLESKPKVSNIISEYSMEIIDNILFNEKQELHPKDRKIINRLSLPTYLPNH
ncbi:13290_t:CDS:2 [Gigaspora rosea]|nr:13290_t:CDS:2 [Gigaspora rosea]